MITLKHLRYLVAIADHLHFRRAAESAHVSQPTLSGQLRDMEDKLGVQLVERSRSRVLLTPLGKEISVRARAILRDVEDLMDVAKHGQNLLEGMFRLGVLPTINPYLLPHILPDLHERYPKLKLYVREATQGPLIDSLESGKLDLLLLPLPVRGNDLETTRLFREPLWIVAPKGHALEGRSHATRDDLNGETVLALEKGHQLHDQVRELCDSVNARFALDYEGTSLDTLRQMVAMGLGISFLPALYVASEIKEGEPLVVRRLSPRTPSRVIGMVWRRHSARRWEFLELAEFIRATLGRVPNITVLS